jgi:hypothetical protein
MKELKHVPDTNSYMQLCLRQEGRGNLYLMVPTYWNAVNKQWIGFVKTPDTGKMIAASGKDSQELQDNFNIELHKAFEEYHEEVFSMFHPLEYWEQKIQND